MEDNFAILLPPAKTDKTMVITDRVGRDLITRAETQIMASVSKGILSGQEGSREITQVTETTIIKHSLGMGSTMFQSQTDSRETFRGEGVHLPLSTSCRY